MQKLHMLDEVFDQYDIVVMLDIDMFTRKGMEEDIFDEEGVGMFVGCHVNIFKGLQRKQPTLTDPNYPYWGGSIYRLDRDLRQTLRKHIRFDEIKKFSGQGQFEDEGAMHRLVTLAQVHPPNLPGRLWSHCSFEPGIEHSAIIHIRTKIKPKGLKRFKIENYRDLVKRGLIEE